jgi:hypothetical protein
MANENRAQVRTVRFQPTDLGEVPHVDAFLARLGLGPFDPTTVTSATGRNNNWSGTTSNGTQVFVKQLHEGDSEDRMRRSRVAGDAFADAGSTPRLLGTDDDHFLLAFDHIGDATSADVLAAEGEFDDPLAGRLGATVAAFHSLDAAGFDTSPHPLPPVAGLKALSYRHYTEAVSAELAMWRLLQGDQALIEALVKLRDDDNESVPARGPIHADMRLDQFLLTDGGALYLTDFEEARVGDPARDIGAFAGEFLFHAAATIPVTLADASPLGHTATHEEIVATGVAELEQRSPLVKAFVHAYLDAAPARITDDPGLLVRAASYAGWHMMDRMISMSVHASRLSPITKAAAGIGRTVLLSPASFTSSLGLEA